MPSKETLELFTAEEFITGAVFGTAALVLGALVAYGWQRRHDTPASIVGVLLTGASLTAIHRTQGLPRDLWIGIALLTLGGALYPWARRVPLLSAVLTIPGAWWITRVFEVPAGSWAPWLLFGWIALGAPLVTDFDRHFADRGYGPVLLVVSIAGIFTTLPDTEEILVVFGAAVPIAFLAWPKALASLGAVGVYPTLGLLAWVIAVGGLGRESAIIGAMACLALLVVEPPTRWWRTATLLDRIPYRWWWVPGVGLLQLVLVVLVARWAGLQETPRTAALAAILVLSVAGAVLAFAGHRPVTRISETGANEQKTSHRFDR